MPTRSFYVNAVIRAEEELRRLEAALDMADERGSYHTEDCSNPLKGGVELLDRRRFL